MISRVGGREEEREGVWGRRQEGRKGEEKGQIPNVMVVEVIAR